MVIDQIASLQFQQYMSANLPPVQSWDLSTARDSEALHFSNQQFFQIVVSCKPQRFGSLQPSSITRYLILGTYRPSERRYEDGARRLRKLSPDSSDANGSTTVTYDTQLSTTKGPRFLSAINVTCNYEAESDPKSIKCDEVEFEFTDTSGNTHAFIACRHKSVSLTLHT